MERTGRNPNADAIAARLKREQADFEWVRAAPGRKLVGGERVEAGPRGETRGKPEVPRQTLGETRASAGDSREFRRRVKEMDALRMRALNNAERLRNQGLTHAADSSEATAFAYERIIQLLKRAA